jgi:hypothetical protein
MENNIKVPIWKIAAVLIGFPLVSYILSLLLLNKNWFSEIGLDFFTVFWLLISFWYLIQIGVIIKVLQASKMNLSDIGYSFNRKKTIKFIIGYLIFAFALFTLVEFALASANITAEKLNSLSDFSNLTPKTTTHRIIFIFAGLVAGISEEFVYRGFAIQSLEKYKINKWIAVVLAAIPFVFQHGLKSIDQFWWFFISGLVLGLIYILTKKKLYITIIIHWIIILSALLAILQLLE